MFTALCLGWVLWGLDLSVARGALAQAHWQFLAPMFALYLLSHTLRTWRLGLLLGVPVPFRRPLGAHQAFTCPRR